MKSWANKSLLSAGCFLVLATLTYSTHPTEPLPPGMLPYTPTRLEWLELELGTCCREDYNGFPYTSLHYQAKRPDTIVVIVSYTDNAQAGMVDLTAKQGKEWAEKVASSYGWSSWVKIEVQRQSLSHAQP